MKIIMLMVFVLGSVVTMPSYAGAGHQGNPISSSKKNKQRMVRWYHKSHVKRGEKVYQKHCASCHQADASGGQNWHEKDEHGTYPAPPLNGTGHAWHHSKNILRRTILKGNKQLGGTMPGFSQKLSEQEVEDVIAWFQSHWPDPLYDAWVRRH